MRSKWWGIVAALAVVAAACGGGGSDAGGGGSAGCPVDALADVRGETEITFWHVATGNNEVVLEQLVDAFEAENPDIDVKLVAQGSYPELLQKYKSGLSTGDQPDVAQMEDTTIQTLIDSDSTVPLQACVDADDYSLADFVPRAIAFYTTEDVLRSMPWNVSNPVLFYNRNAFRRAGLDPDDPPATFEEIEEYSRRIVETGASAHGMALHVEPYVNEYLYAKSGQMYVNNGNGRKARATEALLDNETGLTIWSWWKDMVDSGLALSTGAQPNTFDHVYAVGNNLAAMTFEASGVIGPAAAVIASGQFRDVEIGVGPLPATEPGGGVPVGDGSLWMPKSSSPAEKAAVWQLVKFLSEPAQQAALSVGSQGGYVPIRRSAVDDPALRALWAEKPYLKVPYDQLLSGPTNDVTAGSVIGDYQGVRDAVRDGMARMLASGLSPEDALARTEAAATDAIQAYNERVGS
jgi:sn-glycerol 3-phosphate transport system substrate-binding protein